MVEISESGHIQNDTRRVAQASSNSNHDVAMLKQMARLLIVDDEQDTCSNLSDIFTDLGFQVDVAYHGSAALALVERNTYDVALLDLRMPGMDGLELYRHIHRISAGTVAIMVTAYASSATTASALDAGAWRVLPKPVNFPKLLQLVDEALNQPLVLVVDDDRDLCESLWELFRDYSYRVCLAHDVRAAVDKLHERVSRCGGRHETSDGRWDRGAGLSATDQSTGTQYRDNRTSQ